MDLIFHGPLGMELSLDRSAGVPRVKAAEHDSPALLVVGRALTAIEGVPVGEIRDKKSWLAVVAKLQAPERPLSLSFEAPPEEDPVAAEERARAELQPVAERAECALSTEHIEERFLARERARMTKDYRTADAIERELTLAGVLHDKARWWIPGTSREGPMPCARDTGALCRYYSAGRPCPHGDRCQFLHADDSRPGERVPVASSARPPSPPGLGQRPTRRHLVAATESTRPPQPPVESEEPAAHGPSDEFIRERIFARALARRARDHKRADGILAELGRAGVRLEFVDSNSRDLVKWTADGRSGPRPPDDDAIFGMVLAREKARLVKDYAAADRMQAEMAASGFDIVYRDVTGREDKSRGAVTWFTIDGRTGPPQLSTAEIESRLRALLRERNVCGSRATDLLADCIARGIGRSENWNSAGGQWFTTHGQRGPMPSLEGNAPGAPPVPSAVSESGGICTSLGDRHEASWREATVGRCPPDAFIRQRLVERAIARLKRDFRRADAIEAELAREGVQTFAVAAPVKGLVRWTTTDGRSGPNPPSDSEIYDMMLAYEQGKHDRFSSKSFHQKLAEMTVSGVVSDNFDRAGRLYKQGALRWFSIDGRTGPPKMSERDIEARVREWARAQADRNFRRSGDLRDDLAARGVRVDRHDWFTAGPGGLSGPTSLDRNRSRSRSRSPRRSRYDTALPAANHYGPAPPQAPPPANRYGPAPGKRPRPPSPPGLEQRPTRRHLVAAAPAPSEASSSDGF